MALLAQERRILVRIRSRNEAPAVDTTRSSTVTVSKRTSTSRSRRASTGTR